MGYTLAGAGQKNDAALRRAMVTGRCLGSFAVEKFGLERLRSLKRSEIHARARHFAKLTPIQVVACKLFWVLRRTRRNRTMLPLDTIIYRLFVGCAAWRGDRYGAPDTPAPGRDSHGRMRFRWGRRCSPFCRWKIARTTGDTSTTRIASNIVQGIGFLGSRRHFARTWQRDRADHGGHNFCGGLRWAWEPGPGRITLFRLLRACWCWGR